MAIVYINVRNELNEFNESIELTVDKVGQMDAEKLKEHILFSASKLPEDTTGNTPIPNKWDTGDWIIG